MKWRRWTRRKKLVTVILLLMLIVAIREGALTLRSWIIIRRYMMPEIYTFSSWAEIGGEHKARVEKFLRVRVPRSAKEIYFFRTGGRDRVNYCSFVLPPGEIDKFAEEFVGVPLSRFHKLQDYGDKLYGGYIAVSGPAHCGEKWKSPYWDIGEILDRCIGFGTDKRFPGTRNIMIVNPDTNRVYACIWNR